MHLVSVFFIFAFIFKSFSMKDNDDVLSEMTETKNSTNNEVIGLDFDEIGEIFQEAVHSYLAEDWKACIKGFEKARQSYRNYKKAVISCRRTCRKKAEQEQPFFRENIGDLHFYERKLKETLCLSLCARQYNGKNVLEISPRDIETKLAHFRDYEYLHICYFHKNQYMKAANAVFTFLVHHPEHKMSRKYIEHYLTSGDVEKEKLRNLEEQLHLKEYKKGVEAYDDEDYTVVVTHLENSLWAYLEAENECRIYCEGSFDQGWFPDFTVSIANHFTYCLQCKENCTKILSTINGDLQSDFLPSHYHYLQFAYYKIGDLKNACAAAESYLLFYPVDEVMLKNKKYYAAYPKVTKDYFTPRIEAVKYIKREIYEKKLLQYVSKEFQLLTLEKKV